MSLLLFTERRDRCFRERKSDEKFRDGFPYSSARHSLALCNLGGHAGGQGEKIHHQGRVSLESPTG